MVIEIPQKFKRAAAVIVFDPEMVKGRLCQSSGSEHSPDQSLSRLVNSFLEKEYKEVENREIDDEETDDEIFGSKRECFDFEARDALKGLFDQIDGAKTSIHEAVKTAMEEVGNFSDNPDFKRRLMARLRRRGYDAGLCKSKWEKVGKSIPGSYEYIDVSLSGRRYIIEVSLAKEFEIARPTGSYSELLDVFPPVFVGKPEELKQITKIMCKSIKTSMKCAGMSVPPWRRLAYVQSKWFGYYKRTMNEFAAQKAVLSDEELKKKRAVGFLPVSAVPFISKKGNIAGAGARVGNLALALGGP